jgi:thymidylate synthase (FAD)
MNRVPVLDHGFLQLVETWGSDERIIEAARMSTRKGFLGWGPLSNYRCRKCNKEVLEDETVPSTTPGLPIHQCGGFVDINSKPGDEKLLRFMWENQHSTPFEFAGAVIEVQAPIFVFREWHRHRTQSFSEASARYSPLPDMNYVPTVERLMQAGTSNKQSQALAPINERNARIFVEVLKREYADAQVVYEDALANGVAKELARLVLPVGRYSKMRASANLRNWLSFLTLRQAPNAQFEIRAYANALHDMLAEKFPRTLALFDEGKAR